MRRFSTAGCRVALATALGNTNHMALARVARHGGGDARALTIRVFESALHAVDDVIAGQAEAGAITAVSAAAAVRDGRLRAIAMSSPQRLHGAFAGTPTWTELGVDCVVGTWRGVIGAADILPEQADFWRRVLRAATLTPEWAALLDSQYWGAEWREGSPLLDFLDAERTLLGSTLRELGLCGGT
jgi:putative tricarboxylic transport membrane protein